MKVLNQVEFNPANQFKMRYDVFIKKAVKPCHKEEHVQ